MPIYPDKNLRRDYSAQSSIEFMLVIMMAAALLTPIFIILSTQTSNIEETKRNVEISGAIDTIMEAGKIVNAQGPPSKMIVSVKLPSAVDSIVIENREIVFYIMQDDIMNSIVEGVDFNISGNITNSEGLHRVIVKSVSSGGNTWVNISE